MENAGFQAAEEWTAGISVQFGCVSHLPACNMDEYGIYLDGKSRIYFDGIVRNRNLQIKDDHVWIVWATAPENPTAFSGHGGKVGPSHCWDATPFAGSTAPTRS